MNRIAFSLLIIVLGANYIAYTTATCSGSPPTENGLPCASTTRYWDTNLGACGCGSNNVPYSWNGVQYTAAGSQALYDPGGSSWCGSGCGTCYKLTPTGDCPTGGPCASNTSPITVMITNLCPNNGNTEWCPNPGQANQFGYHAHFDLRDPNMSGWVDSLGWNNPVVTYQQVACSTGGSNTPTCSEASTCECGTSPCSASGGSSTATSTHSTTAATTATTTHSTTATTTSTTSSSSSSTGGTSGCHASVSSAIVNPYSGGGGMTITVTNTGTSVIKSLELTITGNPSVYNLNIVSGTDQYNLASYAFPFAVGSKFTGAGLNYVGSAPSVSLFSVGC